MAEAPPPQPGARSRPRLPSLGGLVGAPAFPWSLAAVALVAAAIFGALWWGERSEDARAAEVEATTRRFAEALTTFSAQTIGRDVAEIRSYAVGRFADEVEQTFDQARIAAIRESEARSTGRVESVFVQHLDQNDATAFTVVRETVVNAAESAPRIDVLRIEIGLLETDDGWRVENVQVFPAPGGFPIG